MPAVAAGRTRDSSVFQFAFLYGITETRGRAQTAASCLPVLPAARTPAFRLRVGLPAPPSLFPQLHVPVPASGTPASRPVVAPSRWPRAGDAGSFVSALVPASLLSPRVARGSAGSRSPCHGRHTAPAPCCRPWPATASPEHTGEGSPLTAPPLRHDETSGNHCCSHQPASSSR